jgi:hypothetical protein
MQRQDVLTHNLANVSTNGFRAEMAAFRAVPIRGDGASTRVLALETTIGYNAEPGAVQPTGRNLDVAVKGKSWLAVQALDGTEAYTRAGALDVERRGHAASPPRGCRGGGRRRAHHRAAELGGGDRQRRHRHGTHRQRAAEQHRAAEARHARGPLHARHRRPVPGCRRRPAGRTPPRACRPARWRAPT